MFGSPKSLSAEELGIHAVSPAGHVPLFVTSAKSIK